MKEACVGNIKIGKGHPLCVISGPCVIESREHALKAAEWLKENVTLPFIFKSSFDKANRSSLISFRGPGMDAGLKILEEIKIELEIPVITDIHLPEQAAPVAEVVDIVQIPAFLCRQTDLLVAAAKTGKPLNVKKGQFLAPWDMKNVVEKIEQSGCDNFFLTDRGTSFGYNNLVTDVRAIPIMQSLGRPVCFDATHSAQLPGGLGHMTGGMREHIPPVTKAAIAAGANAVFLETHPNPEKALCDSATVFPFSELGALLKKLEKLYSVVND